MKIIVFLSFLLFAQSQYDISKESASSLSFGLCNSTNCNKPFGFCLDTNTCLCYPGYANVFEKGVNLKDVKCNYTRKRAINAALLEFFVPFGAGHFYGKRTVIGLAKLLFSSFILLYFVFLYYNTDMDHKIYRLYVTSWLFLFLLLPLINVAELICFFTGIYVDGYGVPFV